MKPWEELTLEEKIAVFQSWVDTVPKMTKEEVIQMYKEDPYFDSEEEELEVINALLGGASPEWLQRMREKYETYLYSHK